MVGQILMQSYSYLTYFLYRSHGRNINSEEKKIVSTKRKKKDLDKFKKKSIILFSKNIIPNFYSSFIEITLWKGERQATSARKTYFCTFIRRLSWTLQGKIGLVAVNPMAYWALNISITVVPAQELQSLPNISSFFFCSTLLTLGSFSASMSKFSLPHSQLPELCFSPLEVWDFGLYETS